VVIADSSAPLASVFQYAPALSADGLFEPLDVCAATQI